MEKLKASLGRYLLLLLPIAIYNAVLMYIALLVLPREETLGDLYRIIYVHVPAAWVAYAAFTIAFISSTAFLVKRNDKYDIVAYSSIVLGTIFVALAIISGSIFSSKAWGTYWEWREPRMTSTLILLLVYLGYLALRFSIGDLDKKRRISGAFSIMAFVTIPLSYISVRVFRSLHPLPELTPEMRIGLYLCFVGILALYIWMMKIFYETEKYKLLMADRNAS